MLSQKQGMKPIIYFNHTLGLYPNLTSTITKIVEVRTKEK